MSTTHGAPNLNSMMHTRNIMNTIRIISTICTIRTMSAISKENAEDTIISMNIMSTMITTAGTK